MPRTESWSHRVGEESVLVYPDGCMDLVWDDDGVWVVGADTGPRSVTRRAGSQISGIRFAPGLLPSLLGVPADELTDSVVPLADVGPSLVRSLGTPERARLTASRLDVDRWVRPTVHALASGDSVADVADRLGLTERTLHRRAVAAFGYGPRRLQVILRAGRAIDLVRTGVELSDAAATAGYADYSHLYRDIVRLTGRRPAQFRPAGPGLSESRQRLA
ncbi:MAG: helix-turn-helix domain-containing protein [Gordonia sp. (in: high G+C Gram-positive bacteria)]|nr:helix-turn-helix domain-containing protein [Gordonia sp. (in: high G+C Gram-positive bacteria)]